MHSSGYQDYKGCRDRCEQALLDLPVVAIPRHGQGTPVQEPAQCTQTVKTMQTKGQSLEQRIASSNKQLD
jgi:hypothetical protein